MHITFVKKILADGSPCPKCGDVEARLKNAGHWQRLDEVVIADERNPDSPGMRLAEELGVTRAPFFVVREDSGKVTVHTVYLRFARTVLNASVDRSAENKDLLESHPELDSL